MVVDTVKGTRGRWGVSTTRGVERAWMIVDEGAERSQILRYMASSRILVPLKNSGRTPARVYSSGFWYGAVVDINELPAVPVYEEENPPERLLEEYIVAPNDTTYANVGFSPWNKTISPENPADSPKPVRALYGYVRYRDAFGRDHELRFGYVFEPFPHSPEGTFKRGAPVGYNRAT